jgi:hypothetical protein
MREHVAFVVQRDLPMRATGVLRYSLVQYLERHGGSPFPRLTKPWRMVELAQPMMVFP